MLIIAIAMIGIASAAVIMPPIGGESGFYDITSSPSGAAVTVDATTVGNTPTTATVYVTGTPGHTIAVNLAGYQPWSQYVPGNPAAGQHIPIHASLVPIVQTGNIYVNTNPSGASAILDNGYDQPTTPRERSTRSAQDGTMFRCRDRVPIIFHQYRGETRCNEQRVCHPCSVCYDLGQYQLLHFLSGPACMWIQSIRDSPTRSWVTLR